MGRHTIAHLVTIGDVVTIVDDDLAVVYEVTGGLPLFLGAASSIIGLNILPNSVGHCRRIANTTMQIQVCQNRLILAGRSTYTVNVLGIDETATDTFGYIDKV